MSKNSSLMPQYEVKKVVAVCFMEAVSTVLQELGAYQMSLADHGKPGPEDLPHVYGSIRRLRDYLHRCLGAYQTTVELDLHEEDCALLVTCSAHVIQQIDCAFENKRFREQEEQWLRQKQTLLLEWGVKLAEEPIWELPLPKPETHSQTLTRFLMDIGNKLAGAASDGVATGVIPFVGGHTVTFGADPKEGEEAGTSPPVADDGHAGRDPKGTTTEILNARSIGDPRLRALASLDQHAYQRALEAEDYRLACVHLVSLVEAAVVDYALARKKELGLTGSPGGWHIPQLMKQLLEKGGLPEHKKKVEAMFRVRNTLLPARQLDSPIAVTKDVHRRIVAFARVVLGTVGIPGKPGQTPAPAKARKARKGS